MGVLQSVAKAAGAAGKAGLVPAKVVVPKELGELTKLAQTAAKAKTAAKLPDMQKAIELGRTVATNGKLDVGFRSKALTSLADIDAASAKVAGWGPSKIEPSIGRAADVVVKKLNDWMNIDEAALARDQALAFVAKHRNISNEALLAIARPFASTVRMLDAQ